MTLSEKKLYHQIHPLKLFTDWLTGTLSLVYVGKHELVQALVVAFVPAIAVSYYLITFADLNGIKKSREGKYIKKHMRPHVEALRMGGFFVMTFGAWMHMSGVVGGGFVIILAAWLYGLVL